jgi:hypothetical protein
VFKLAWWLACAAESRVARRPLVRVGGTQDSRETTTRRVGAAPECVGKGGGVAGESKRARGGRSARERGH